MLSSLYSYMLNWDDSTENKFINLIYNLYESVYVPQIDTVRYKRITKNINIILHQNIKNIEDYATMINYSSTLDYDILYSFSKFVKLTEKCFFYTNDSSARIACDNKMQDKTKIIVFVLDNATVKFTMNMEQYKKVIKIHIIREYGKSMENNYRIEDGKLYSENSDDLMLLDIITHTINHMIASFLIYWGTIIVNKSIEEHIIDNGVSHIYDYWDNDLSIRCVSGTTDSYYAEELFLEKYKNKYEIIASIQPSRLAWCYNISTKGDMNEE